jgi:DNA-binding NtrC family response regulator
MSGKILVVDDEKDMLVLIKRILAGKTPHEVEVTDDPMLVKGLLQKNNYDIVMTDLKMPQCDGIHVLEMVKERNRDTAVIIMTAYGTIESAIEATRKGAFDYITKPFRKERILHIVEQAMKWQSLQRENTILRERLECRSPFPALIGNSSAMQSLHSQIDRVAKTSATVLITGESGTGKELVARAIHTHSLRKDKPFIPISCSTIPESIIESELFGHLRGSFTGALKDKKGLVEEANSGTLFLDEIGDLSPVMQVKLLRLIQEGEYKSIGSNTIRKVDIRLITATHQDLPERIKSGEFREDLYYRINVINIHLPPLRERVEDIPILAHSFLQKYNLLHNKKIETLSREVTDYLMRRNWPGNVRELENVIERGVIMSPGNVLQVADIAPPVPASRPSSAAPSVAPSEEIFSLPFKEAKDKLIDDFQTRYISKVLARHSGNVSQAAKESGLKRQYLHRLMRDTNVDAKTYKKTEPSE